MEWLGPDPEGDDFAGELLESLEAERTARQRTERGAAGGPIIAEDSPELQEKLATLDELAHGLSIGRLAAVLCELSLVLCQLRAWYTVGLGHLLLSLLKLAASTTQRLPRQPGVSPELATLRLLEGLVLIYTVRHARERTAQVLESLVVRRRLPTSSLTRVEAALMGLQESLGCPRAGMPAIVPLDEQAGEAFLQDLAESLRPDDEHLGRAERAKESLEQAIGLVFPGSTPEYFGSAVNGFCMQTSDLDCVVQVDPKLISLDADKQSEKEIATGAVMLLSRALESMAELRKLGLEVKEVVTKARVPLLKCESSEGVAVDISFNNTLPLHNSRLLHAFSKLDDRVQQMGCLVKWWARCRGVNDAYEGTLSPYAHVLLVIHYLQRLGLVPMLEEDSASNAHPSMSWGQQRRYRYAPCAVPSPELQCATLRGLLAGFFRYFAYEFPAHSEVVTLWARSGPVFKPEFFQSLRAESSESGAPEAAEEQLPENQDEEEEHLASEPNSTGPSPVLQPSRPPSLGPSPVLQPSRPPSLGVGAAEALSQERLPLPAAEQHVQNGLKARSLLCIADPLEVGRTLGANFLGFERLVGEQRRACRVLSGAGDRHLEELFAAPKKRPAAAGKAGFSGAAGAGAQDPPQPKVVQAVVQIPKHEIGRVMGRSGAQMKLFQSIKGIQSMHMWRGEGTDADGTTPLRIKGSPEAVAECSEKVRAFLTQTSGGSRPAEAKREAVASPGYAWQPSLRQNVGQIAQRDRSQIARHDRSQIAHHDRSSAENWSEDEAPEPVAEPLPDKAVKSGPSLPRNKIVPAGNIWKRGDLVGALDLSDVGATAKSQEADGLAESRTGEEGASGGGAAQAAAAAAQPELASAAEQSRQRAPRRLQMAGGEWGTDNIDRWWRNRSPRTQEPRTQDPPDCSQGTDNIDRWWRNRSPSTQEPPSEASSAGKRVWKRGQQHRAPAATEPAAARGRRAGGSGGGPDDGAGGPGPAAFTYYAHSGAAGEPAAGNERLWREVSPRRLQELPERHRRWATAAAASAAVEAGGEREDDAEGKGAPSPSPEKPKKNKTAKMKAEDVRSFRDRRLVALTNASLWTKDEQLVVVGGTETVWKVRSLDKTRNFTLRKDNEGEVWKWK